MILQVQFFLTVCTDNLNKKDDDFGDLHPFSWTDIIKLLFENEFGILPDSFRLI